MTCSWRKSRIGGHSPPVEMRFIDMFMASLGALVFMSMLLAFLLRFVPSDHTSKSTTAAPSQSAEPLQIVTASLPPSQADMPYELALAYRGGIMPITWEVPAGREEIPSGMTFNTQNGVLSGTPRAAVTARFIVRVIDAKGQTDEKPLELQVLADSKTSKWIEHIVTLVAICLLVWIVCRNYLIAKTFQHWVVLLKEGWSEGQESMQVRTGPHEVDVIQLPEGIDPYQTRVQKARRNVGIALCSLGLAVLFFIWRLWTT